MTTIAEVRGELARLAGTIPGWRGAAYVDGTLASPMIKVSRPAFDPRFVFEGTKKSLTFRCTAYVPLSYGARGEAQLDALAEPSGAGSFIATVQDGTAWAVDVDYASVVLVGETVLTQFGNETADYLALPFDVEVVF